MEQFHENIKSVWNIETFSFGERGVRKIGVRIAKTGSSNVYVG